MSTAWFVTMPTLLEPQWLVPLFVATFLGGVALMARIAGWASLARSFRANGVPEGQSLRFVTGSLGALAFPIRYRNCLHLARNSEGLYVSLMFPFKFASPALFVPWSEVASCTVEQAFSTQVVVLQLRGQWSAIKLPGAAGQWAREAYQAYPAKEMPAATAG